VTNRAPRPLFSSEGQNLGVDEHHAVRRQVVGDLNDNLLVEHELVTGLAWIVPHGDVLRASFGSRPLSSTP
jgi:hypothetical protein